MFNENNVDDALQMRAVDPQKALSILMPLGDRRDPRALAGIAQMYEQGIGVPQDLGEAYYWYNRSAECFPMTKKDVRDLVIASRDTVGEKLDKARLESIQMRCGNLAKSEKAPIGPMMLAFGSGLLIYAVVAALFSLNGISLGALPAVLIAAIGYFGVKKMLDK
jgi:hypothetical protein